MSDDFLKGIGRFIPPELRRFAPTFKAAAQLLKPNPIVNNPSTANLIRSPSLANLGKVLSDVAITGTEVLPGGKLITTPVKKVSKLADDFFDYCYRVKPSDTPPKDPLGELKPKDDKVKIKKDIVKDEVKTVKDEVENVTRRDDRFGLFKRQQLAAPKSEIERLFKSTQVKKIFRENKNQLIRGHALEPSAASVIPEVKGIKDFSIYEVIPKKLLENVVLTRASDVRRPLFFTTEKGNKIHEKLGRSLIKDLVEKYRVQGYVFKPNKKTKGGEWVFDEKIIPENQVEKIKELNKSISLKEKELTDLKLQTMFYDPAKDRLVYFGSSPTSLADLRKTMIERGFNKGGMANIFDMTRKLNAQR